MTDLPDGWTFVPLNEATEDVASLNPALTPDSEFRYVDIGSISNRSFTIVEPKRFMGRDAPSRARRPIRQGDVLFSNVRTYLRNIAQVTPPAEANIASTGITVLRPNGRLNSRFLFHYVTSDAFIEAVTPHQTGSNYPATSDRVVRSMMIPLPPLDEQQRIAARLDDLLERVAATRERLDRIPTTLRRFRQSVLSAAVSGRLTEDLRKPGDTTPLDEVGLPDSWTRATFKDVCRHITVGHVGPMVHEYVDAGIPWLRSLNVKEFKLGLANLKFVSAEFHSKMRKTALAPGDVVIIRTGNAGKACVIPQDLGEANCADLIIVRPADQLDADYATIYINCLTMRAHVEQEMVGIAQGHFNIGSMRMTPLPLPPIAEQREIARRTRKLLAIADDVERRWESAQLRLNPLGQSILSRAFRGELS